MNVTLSLTESVGNSVSQAWSASQSLGKGFVWSKHATHRFDNYFPHILFVGNLYLFAVLIYKQYCYDPSLARNPTPPVIRQISRVWNFTWSLFSALGCWGTVGMLSRLHEDNLGSGIPAFWAFMYCWTKPLELIDTLLLMASGRNVRLVHWSHHNITMLFTWYAAQSYLKPAVMFACVNFGVHAIMYFYYFLVSYQSLRRVLKKYAWIAVRILPTVQSSRSHCIWNHVPLLPHSLCGNVSRTISF
jgi:hypothetical protein